MDIDNSGVKALGGAQVEGINGGGDIRNTFNSKLKKKDLGTQHSKFLLRL